MIAIASTKPSAQREVTLTRTFDATRRMVFKLWTEPEHMAQWWGPKGFTNPVCELDARPGGAIRIHMRAPDGTVYPMSGTFREVVEPERLVFSAIAEDLEGNPLLEALTTVTFAEHGGKTTLKTVVLHQSVEGRDAHVASGMEEGASASYDRLAQ